MKFRMDREALADAVAWTARSLPSRPTVPVLAGLLLTVDGDTLTVSGFDYEVSARAEMAIDAGDPGAALVSGRLLAEITRSLPAQPVQFATEGTRVVLTCGTTRVPSVANCTGWAGRLRVISANSRPDTNAAPGSPASIAISARAETS